MDTFLGCALIIWALVVWGLWFSRSHTSRLLGANFIAIQVAAITSVAVMITTSLAHTHHPPLHWITESIFIIAAMAMALELKKDSPRPR